MNETGNLIKAKADAIAALAHSLTQAIDLGEVESLAQVRSYLKTWTAATFELVPAEVPAQPAPHQHRASCHGSIGELVCGETARTPRVWNDGDPEPAIGTIARDKDGDSWTRCDNGMWAHRLRGSAPALRRLEEGTEAWPRVIRFAPLTEVI